MPPLHVRGGGERFFAEARRRKLGSGRRNSTTHAIQISCELSGTGSFLEYAAALLIGIEAVLARGFPGAWSRS